MSEYGKTVIGSVSGGGGWWMVGGGGGGSGVPAPPSRRATSLQMSRPGCRPKSRLSDLEVEAGSQVDLRVDCGTGRGFRVPPATRSTLGAALTTASRGCSASPWERRCALAAGGHPSPHFLFVAAGVGR